VGYHFPTGRPICHSFAEARPALGNTHARCRRAGRTVYGFARKKEEHHAPLRIFKIVGVVEVGCRATDGLRYEPLCVA